jgi:AcrR family transcriptional regulator
MPRSAKRHAEVRKKIINSARRLFNRRGFNGVSIDHVMAEAGLTRGSFYSYFKTKSDLYAQAVASVVNEKREGGAGHDQDRFSADQIVRDYLSAQHFEDVDGGCPMIGLPSDISRSSRPVREAFESALRLMIEMFERDMKPADQSGRDRAVAIAALCVGGMVLARSVENAGLADDLRKAAMSTALLLGGWQ